VERFFDKIRICVTRTFSIQASIKIANHEELDLHGSFGSFIGRTSMVDKKALSTFVACTATSCWKRSKEYKYNFMIARDVISVINMRQTRTMI